MRTADIRAMFHCCVFTLLLLCLQRYLVFIFQPLGFLAGRVVSIHFRILFFHLWSPLLSSLFYVFCSRMFVEENSERLTFPVCLPFQTFLLKCLCKYTRKMESWNELQKCETGSWTYYQTNTVVTTRRHPTSQRRWNFCVTLQGWRNGRVQSRTGFWFLVCVAVHKLSFLRCPANEDERFSFGCVGDVCGTIMIKGYLF